MYLQTTPFKQALRRMQEGNGERQNRPLSPHYPIYWRIIVLAISAILSA